MLLTAPAETARANRRRGSAADGVTFWHTLYLGTSRYNMAPGTAEPEKSALFPMAFLVEQDPGSTASAHYHQQDQFQLVVDGHGIMGTHEVGPVTVHFTGAYTAYGPIRADKEAGVHYFTLRNGFDPGARFTGPAIVTQPDCTILVPPGWSARIDGLGNVEMERV
jgi:oxalate decarboxylase/phosphoglucose isomerase-like protein (cupin superfamily)